VIMLNRPDAMNAISSQVADELAGAFLQTAADPAVWVIVLAAAGERAFCVGADLRSWGEDLLGNSSEYWKWFGAFKDMVRA